MVFVGHSYGGLVIKQLLRAADRDAAQDPFAAALLERSKEVVFFGTPHRGAALASLADLFRSILRPSHVLELLRFGNAQNQELFYWYKEFSQSRRLRHLPLSEGKPVSIRGLTLWELIGMVVQVHSSDPGVAEAPRILVDEDHISISKPQSRDSDAYVFLSDFLKEAGSWELPPGFTSPESLADSDGLRARLREEVQAYVPATDGPTIEALLQQLQNHERPLAITGEGGLGKTRLALELWRASGHVGVLIQPHATAQGINDIIQRAKNDNIKVMFIIDYIEEIGNKYDEYHQIITRRSGGFAFLVTTSRVIGGNLGVSAGSNYLDSRYCQEISLSEGWLRPWRRRICEQILRMAGVPEDIVDKLGELDIPVIATLIAYDFLTHGVTDVAGIGIGDDGVWLTKRLRNHAAGTLCPEDFAMLLSIYPLNMEIRAALPKEFRAVSDNLQRQGWVSAVSTGGQMEWRLGHDLLSDIPLVTLLLAEKQPTLRFELIERLRQQADALGAKDRFARSLSRALRRLIAGTRGADVLDTLQACLPSLSSANSHSVLAEEVGMMVPYSLSLSLYEKLTALEKIPELSRKQLFDLKVVFDEETEKFRDLARDYENDLRKFICRRAIGSIKKRSEILSIYGIIDSECDDEFVNLGELFSMFMPEFHVNFHILNSINTDKGVSDQSLDTLLSHMPKASEISKLSMEKRKWIATAMLDCAVSIAEKSKNFLCYDDLIIRFVDDPHPDVRLIAASAAFDRAYDLSVRDGDPAVYDDVILRFGADPTPDVRAIAARAAFNRANDLFARDGDPAVYDEVISRFGDDPAPEVRAEAARAATVRAGRLFEREGDLTVYDQVIDRFTDDPHPEIRKVVATAKAGRMGWLVVAGRVPEALAVGETLLADPSIDRGDRAAVAFIIWMAEPTPGHKERAEALVAALDGESNGWTFDEFADRIATFEAEDRAFAMSVIKRIERERN